jgi:hypothetical protein
MCCEAGISGAIGYVFGVLLGYDVTCLCTECSPKLYCILPTKLNTEREVPLSVKFSIILYIDSCTLGEYAASTFGVK